VPLVVKYLKGQNNPVSDLEGDVNIESDCEEGPPGDKKGIQKAKEEKGEETRAVFITGSFSAYAPSHLVSFLREMTGSSAGNHYSSTAARTQSCSPPSNRRVSTLARITSAKRRWR
jgi:hypothetical protein